MELKQIEVNMKILFVLVAIFYCSTNLFSASLTLNNYLKLVSEKHGGYYTATNNASGALTHLSEAKLLYSPIFLASYQNTNSKALTTNVGATGDQIKMDSYLFGITQNTWFGLSATLSYNIIHYDIHGASALYVPVPKYYDSKPTLELKQSLWRNFFGSETRATENTLIARAKATNYSEIFKTKALLVEAENTYWKLVLVRETVRVQKDSFERAKKIYDWNAKRVSNNLADKSDIFQAEAAMKQRQLDYKASMQEERGASLALNNMIEIKSEEVSETLDGFNTNFIETFEKPDLKQSREDTLSLKETINMTVANANLSKERNRPSLDLSLSYSRAGRDKEFGESYSDSTKNDNPTTTVGVKFSTPLSFWLMKETNSGYEKEIMAANRVYERKLFEENQEKANLLKKLDEARERLLLAKDLENLQKNKLEYERDRLKRGRTTTYQVLLFEQDYSLSQLSKLRIQTEIMMLVASLKTYGATL